MAEMAISRRTVLALPAVGLAARAASSGAVVSIRSDNVLLLRGKPVFPIGLTKAPPPDGKTPDGREAYAEIATNGTMFHRCGASKGQWNAEAEASLDFILRRSAEAGIYAAIMISDLQALGPEDRKKETEIRRLITKYRSQPSLFFWKGEDEPEWGKVAVAKVQRYYDIVHELDPDHPVWIVQAPRGTVETLKRYDATYDVGGVDIYPVSYPLNNHAPQTGNRNISAVGDWAKVMREVTGGRKPVIMTLQIAFSGTVRPGKTLRFPTFPEQRYMTYQAIILGARGLIYFGGDIPVSLNERDRKLGWNWTYYARVLKPVLDELNPAGPLFPALIAPDSKLPVKVTGADGIEFCVREAGEYLYLLAAKREGATVNAQFSGLPPVAATGELLYEEPRMVTVANRAFTDWFGPNEVHAYRFRRL